MVVVVSLAVCGVESTFVRSIEALLIHKYIKRSMTVSSVLASVSLGFGAGFGFGADIGEFAARG